MKGRNNNGYITSVNRAGGRKYRHVIFIEKNLMYLEMRELNTILIDHVTMLVKFEDNSYAYYLAPQKIKIGDNENGSKEIKIGNCSHCKIFQLVLTFIMLKFSLALVEK